METSQNAFEQEYQNELIIIYNKYFKNNKSVFITYKDFVKFCYRRTWRI